ncbi:MAG: HEAT repeat domain-containing protein [Candidatus Omnitrophica bacterium]|nr:HEAT repeat domain-containing protein [Candidatus Omnitrophota bacterium]
MAKNVFAAVLFFFACFPIGAQAEEGQKVDPAHIQALIRDLGSKNPQLRREAAVALTRIGPPAKEAVPALIRNLDDENALVRQNSIDALGEIRVNGAGLIPALIRRLKEDEEYLNRLKAAEVLGKFGKEAREAAPALLEAVKDEKAIVRGFVVEAIGTVVEPKEAVKALVKALEDPHPSVRRKAKQALEAMDAPEAKKALEPYAKPAG